MSVTIDVGFDNAPENRRIAEMRRHLCEHKARLNRLIVQGLPTQSMEDSLRKMEAGLRLQERCLAAAHREGLPEPRFPPAASQQHANPTGDAAPSRSPRRAA